MKLDSEWIKRLRNAWMHPVSEQIPLQVKYSTAFEYGRRLSVVAKPTNRRLIRPSISHIKPFLITDMIDELDEESTTKDNYCHQKFIDWRSFLNNNNSPYFQLYILPVKV